jgi:hypothetical protein
VAEIVLNEPQIVLAVGEIEATGVPRHVWPDGRMSAATVPGRAAAVVPRSAASVQEMLRSPPLDENRRAKRPDCDCAGFAIRSC